MNRWQKIAWFNLLIIAACFLACLILAGTIQLEQLVTPPTPLSLVIIPSLVLVAISKFLFHKKSWRVDFDERDVDIHKRSHHVGLWAFVISIVVLNVICVLIIGPHRALDYPVVLLLMICMSGGIWIMADSIVTLVQYSRDAKGE
ncbi:MAG: hypothetical protein JW715_17150 [Sedimentisphaerales bacterium]|nr:hypothetical protein [Sedimentisphaerales bacterium]